MRPISREPRLRAAGTTILLTRGLDPADIFSKLLQVRSQLHAPACLFLPC